MTSTIEQRAPERDGPSAPPSIRRRALVLGLSLPLAAALVAGGTAAIRSAADAAPRPPPAATPSVETLTLSRLDGYDVRRVYAARVEPAREASLAFESGGTLVEVAVEEGDTAPEGAVLARLDTRLIESKRTQLGAARDALDSDAELARLALARQAQLQARGFAPGEALDEARLATTRIAARIAEADAALELVEVELDKTVLRAPFDIRVGARHLDPGATVTPGGAVLAVLDAGTPRLRAGLPPERAAALGTDRTYTFAVGGRTVPARLLARRGDVDTRTRTVSALFEPIGRAGDGLLFGELAELSLTERVGDAVFAVPLTALAEDERGLWSVMSVIASDAAAPGGDGGDAGDGAGSAGSADGADGADGDGAELGRVAVEIVHLAGDRAYVSAAVEDGTRIVADGRHRVVDGERVRIAAAGEERGS